MTSITADGATDTIYILETDGTAIYRINNGMWLGLTFPVTVTNTNGTPASNILKVLFTSDLTITSGLGYITINSSGVQIGNTTVKEDGTKVTITVDGVTDYEGLILNNGNSDTYVYNLNIVATNGSTLALDYGWVGGRFYGSDGTNNFIIGCSSSGPIADGGGGIVGSEVATVNNVGGSAELTILGCTSSGTIGSYAGGIAGSYAGQNSGSILTITKCSSSGTIGLGGGGIVGQVAATNEGTCFVSRCYSTGDIGTNAGGIYGREAGSAGIVYATECYSRGTIGTDGGGIYGREAAIYTGAAVATSCYSSGSISTPGNGIFGSASYEGVSESACYVADGSWSTPTANTTLDMSNFIAVLANQPFELRNIGPSPYSLTTIVNDVMSTTFSGTVAAGSSSIAAVLAGLSSFSIVEIDGEDPAETPSITINSTTGVISTTSDTFVGTYDVLVRAVTNPYSMTTFVLTVTEAPPPPAPVSTATTVPKGKGYDFELYNSIQAGNPLVLERLQNPNIRFKSFEDYNKYIRSWSSLKR